VLIFLSAIFLSFAADFMPRLLHGIVRENPSHPSYPCSNPPSLR
jgi:hypothetical protein